MRVDMCVQRLGYRLQCTLIFLLCINGCDSGSVVDLGAMNISTTFNLAASTFYETSFEITHFTSTQHMEKEESEEEDVSPQQVLLECMESLSPLSHLYCIIALSAVLCFVLLFVLSLIYCCLIRPRLKRQKAYRVDHNPKKRGMKQQQLNSDMDRDMKRSIFMDALSDVMPSTPNKPKIQHLHVQTNTFNGSEIQALTQMHTQLNHTSDHESPSGSIEMGMAGTAAVANNGHGAVHMSDMDQDELDMEARRYTVTGDYGYDYDRPVDQDSEDTHESDGQSPDRNHQTKEAQNKDINLFHIAIDI